LLLRRVEYSRVDFGEVVVEIFVKQMPIRVEFGVDVFEFAF
jgi:hypothetical protein